MSTQVHHQWDYSGLPHQEVLVGWEPFSPAVDAISCTVKHASWILLPAVATPPWTETFTVATTLPTEALAVAASPLATMTLRAPTSCTTAQCSPSAAMTESPLIENMAVIKALHPVNKDISIMDDSPFPSATALWLLK
uniref:Uncharacterized protein n=1 Tax=Romanomermis culicivorax TaxID=13658 RepID=A0A915KX85_ROMCU